VSTLQAGGDLTILATGGSITSEGAGMNAEGNALLAAKDKASDRHGVRSGDPTFWNLIDTDTARTGIGDPIF